jgi:hypothetical protein
MIRLVVATMAIGLTLSACGQQRPAIDPRLESGVTSSNGGGQRATGNVNSVGIGPNGAGVLTRAPNSTGAAY